jgi:hypothetical protein
MLLTKKEKNKRTRSVIVIYKDKIIAEKYADGFDKNSRILGWSMTKSLTATYFGILQKQGKFDIMKSCSNQRNGRMMNVLKLPQMIYYT